MIELGRMGSEIAARNSRLMVTQLIERRVNVSLYDALMIVVRLTVTHDDDSHTSACHLGDLGPRASFVGKSRRDVERLCALSKVCSLKGGRGRSTD